MKTKLDSCKQLLADALMHMASTWFQPSSAAAAIDICPVLREIWTILSIPSESAALDVKMLNVLWRVLSKLSVDFGHQVVSKQPRLIMDIISLACDRLLACVSEIGKSAASANKAELKKSLTFSKFYVNNALTFVRGFPAVFIQLSAVTDNGSISKWLFECYQMVAKCAKQMPTEVEYLKLQSTIRSLQLFVLNEHSVQDSDKLSYLQLLFDSATKHMEAESASVYLEEVWVTLPALSNMSCQKYNVVHKFIENLVAISIETRNIAYINTAIAGLYGQYQKCGDSQGVEHLERVYWTVVFQGNFMKFHIVSQAMVLMACRSSEDALENFMDTLMHMGNSMAGDSFALGRLRLIVRQIGLRIGNSKMEALLMRKNYGETHPFTLIQLIDMHYVSDTAKSQIFAKLIKFIDGLGRQSVNIPVF